MSDTLLFRATQHTATRRPIDDSPVCERRARLPSQPQSRAVCEVSCVRTMSSVPVQAVPMQHQAAMGCGSAPAAPVEVEDRAAPLGPAGSLMLPGRATPCFGPWSPIASGPPQQVAITANPWDTSVTTLYANTANNMTVRGPTHGRRSQPWRLNPMIEDESRAMLQNEGCTKHPTMGNEHLSRRASSTPQCTRRSASLVFAKLEHYISPVGTF